MARIEQEDLSLVYDFFKQNTSQDGFIEFHIPLKIQDGLAIRLVSLYLNENTHPNVTSLKLAKNTYKDAFTHCARLFTKELNYREVNAQPCLTTV